MLINDLVALLMQIPPQLAAAWGVWFFVGLVLSIWQRKERVRLVVHGAAPTRASGVRHPSGPRPQRPAPSVPVSSGDAFGDLETILEPQVSHRRPGDLPDNEDSSFSTTAGSAGFTK